MNLDKLPWKEIQEALIDAFPDKDKLEQMLKFQFNETLDPLGDNFSSIVFKVMKDFESKNKLPDLIEGALKENPSNNKLKIIHQKITLLSVNKKDNGQAQSVQNVILQSSNSSTYQTPSAQFQKEVPHLLPYLANRREQEAELSEVFSNFLKQDLPSHLVCIIHGDESQCHYNFLERMRKVSLPKWLNLNPEEPIIYEYPLEWPSRAKNLHNLSNQLCKNLADVVLNNSLYSSKEIDIALSKHPHPVIVHTHLLTEDLHRQGLDSLNKLLEFCHDLHKKITSQRLIICIFIKYKINRKKTHKNLWFKLLFNFRFDFFKQYRYQQINKNIRKYLQKLSNSDINYIQCQSIVVLPELSGINQGEVENWVRSEDTKNFVGEAMIEPLIQKVGEMFGYWEEETSSDTIPMSYLAKELSKLVESLIAIQTKSS